METSSKPTIKSLLQSAGQDTDELSGSYLHRQQEVQDSKDRNKDTEEAKAMVNNFYDVVTDFYEYGWGDSFHFCAMEKGVCFKDAIARHQLFLAMKLGLKPGETVLDLGCGVGGPARRIAKFSQAKITGINNNDYQIKRAEALTREAGLSHLCTYMKGDFTKLAQETSSIDKAYAIEASCHALVKTEAYGEAFRVLKPGGLYALYEWNLVANKYDPNNPEHIKIARDIQIGNGLPVLDTTTFTLESLKKVGFKIVEYEDRALTSEVPWERPLEPGLTNFRASPLGRMATHSMLFCMEKLGISPKGSTKVHTVLCKGADALLKGAKSEIFTPMFYVLAMKPEISK